MTSLFFSFDDFEDDKPCSTVFAICICHMLSKKAWLLARYSHRRLVLIALPLSKRMLSHALPEESYIVLLRDSFHAKKAQWNAYNHCTLIRFQNWT